MVFTRAFMGSSAHRIVRLEFTSAVEMLDFVQVVGDHVGRELGLDDDAVHWVSVAVRESVVNAIKHGNQHDAGKHVFVEFESTFGSGAPELHIRVRDQGPGFDPETLPDPLAPENLLRSSGRGIFLIRNFMDDVCLQRAPEGGMEIRMVKRAQPGSPCR
jgi:serine/threonine-protein kinase RsbW